MARRGAWVLTVAALTSACAGPGVSPSASFPPTASGPSPAVSPGADLGMPLLADQPTSPQLLQPGRYLIDAPFPIRASVALPQGWALEGLRKETVGLGVLTDAGDWAGWGLAFKIITDVFVDPCAVDQRLRDVGPTADDLVAAFLDLPGYEVTEPTPVTIGGIVGQRIEITVPDLSSAECPGGHLIWIMSGLTKRGQPGNVHHLNILDVNGTRLVIEVDDYAHTSVFEMETWGTPFSPDAHADDLVDLHEMLDSITFH